MIPGEELKAKLSKTKTFNYNVYLGQDRADNCISHDEALDEMVNFIKSRDQETQRRLESAYRATLKTMKEHYESRDQQIALAARSDGASNFVHSLLETMMSNQEWNTSQDNIELYLSKWKEIELATLNQAQKGKL